MALSLNAFHKRQLTLTLDAMTAYPCLKTGSVVSYYQHHHRTLKRKLSVVLHTDEFENSTVLGEDSRAAVKMANPNGKSMDHQNKGCWAHFAQSFCKKRPRGCRGD